MTFPRRRGPAFLADHAGLVPEHREYSEATARGARRRGEAPARGAPRAGEDAAHSRSAPCSTSVSKALLEKETLEAAEFEALVRSAAAPGATSPDAARPQDPLRRSRARARAAAGVGAGPARGGGGSALPARCAPGSARPGSRRCARFRRLRAVRYFGSCLTTTPSLVAASFAGRAWRRALSIRSTSGSAVGTARCEAGPSWRSSWASADTAPASGRQSSASPPGRAPVSGRAAGSAARGRSGRARPTARSRPARCPCDPTYVAASRHTHSPAGRRCSAMVRSGLMNCQPCPRGQHPAHAVAEVRRPP